MSVILYSTNCPKCIILEKKLSAANIGYVVVDDADVMIEKGFTSAPMLDVDGKVMGFKNAVDWVNSK